jgi:hypothetical protein
MQEKRCINMSSNKLMPYTKGGKGNMKTATVIITSFIAGGITMMMWIRRIFNKSMEGN